MGWYRWPTPGGVCFSERPELQREDACGAMAKAGQAPLWVVLDRVLSLELHPTSWLFDFLQSEAARPMR